MLKVVEFYPQRIWVIVGFRVNIRVYKAWGSLGSLVADFFLVFLLVKKWIRFLIDDPGKRYK